MNKMFHFHLHCGEQMGRPHHHCKAVGCIRAVTQYIKMPPLWSYHTCHLSISSYVCQAIRILIAQLIKGPHDWWNRRIYGRSKCWARTRQMCDSIADYYSRIIGCSVKCQPLRPTLNSFAWRHTSSLPPGCNSGILEPRVKIFFQGETTPFIFVSAPRFLRLIVRRGSVIFILSAPGNRCHCCTIIPSRWYLGPGLRFCAQLGFCWPPLLTLSLLLERCVDLSGCIDFFAADIHLPSQ